MRAEWTLTIQSRTGSNAISMVTLTSAREAAFNSITHEAAGYTSIQGARLPAPATMHAACGVLASNLSSTLCNGDVYFRVNTMPSDTFVRKASGFDWAVASVTTGSADEGRKLGGPHEVELSALMFEWC